MLPLTKQSLDKAHYKLSRAIAKLAGITFRRLTFSYWIDNLGFLLGEKLAAIFIKPCSWGFQLAGHLLHQLHANKFSSTIQYRTIMGQRRVMEWRGGELIGEAGRPGVLPTPLARSGARRPT
jgi:hypothetical protein